MTKREEGNSELRDKETHRHEAKNLEFKFPQHKIMKAAKSEESVLCSNLGPPTSQLSGSFVK